MLVQDELFTTSKWEGVLITGEQAIHQNNLILPVGRLVTVMV